MMIHDHVGNATLVMDNRTIVEQAWPVAGAAIGAPLTKKRWVEMARNASTLLLSVGRGASVVCTSASETTRLVFDLVKTGQSTSARFELTSRQDGSIISSSSSFVHLRIQQATEPMQRGATDAQDAAAAPRLPETATNDGALARALRIKVTVDGVEVTETSFQGASTKGILLSFDGQEGTHVLEVSLIETRAGLDLCVAETALLLEIFTADSYMVRRRSSRQIVTSPRVSATAGIDDFQVTSVVFVVDLEVLDGYKLSTLHLMKHLPRNFRASALDLSCVSGDLPVKMLFEEEAFDVFRLCIELPSEMWNSVRRQRPALFSLLHTVLLGSATWKDVVSERPDVALAVGGIYRHLVNFDALVMSNGGKDEDAYLLQVARLAGVRTRMVNLGAIAGGYMSPLFTGATTLVGPSHYVAHNPAVSRNVGELMVKVCHPVMDAARILDAARSCHTGAQTTDVPRRTSELPEQHFTNGGGGTSVAGNGELLPARFIMVGRVSAEKTPGVFVRAMAVLQRRWRSRGRQGMQPTEGVIVGKGPLLQHMERLALNLNASVRFTGALSVDAVPCEVQPATALVLPSFWLETFGMVGPEAMLLGVPVVTFGFGGSGELVNHMENGILVAKPTPKALADALELLATDDVLRDRLGAQARQDALRALSLPEMVACHADELTPHSISDTFPRRDCW